MEEKMIVQGQFGKRNDLALIFFGLGIVSCIISIIDYLENYSDSWPSIGGYFVDSLCFYCSCGIFFYLTIALFLIALFFQFEMRNCALTVTDKRVFGRASFGKRVDLPLDSVSAVATHWPQGISVATSSGRITFHLVKNRDEVHRCISKLLLNRQSRGTATTTIKQEIPQSNADELKKYKELLDSGVITQEEFNAKKKQLLGL